MASPPQKPGVKGAGVLEDARARDEADRQARHHNEELNDACVQLEEDLELLKARFEMYFLGVDRREPARERQEMRRRIARLKGEFTRNTGLRFRIQTLNARFLAYERMWTRCAREKEEGTYRRDLARLRRHHGTGVPARAGTASEPAIAAARRADAEGDGPAPVAPALAPSALEPAGSPSPEPGAELPADRIRVVYDEYVAAKRRCNEDVSRITYDVVAATLAKQVPQLLVKYRARRIDFEVVVREGRAVLKAVPRT